MHGSRRRARASERWQGLHCSLQWFIVIKQKLSIFFEEGLQEAAILERLMLLAQSIERSWLIMIGRVEDS
jgi:hypothetical protein